MFDHSLSVKCIYGSKCTIKLCSFQHEKYVDDKNELVENDKESKNADNDVKNVDQSSDEDEESFQLYVKTNFPAIFKKFKTENTIKCYYRNFLPRSRKLRDLEDEMMMHIRSYTQRCYKQIR